MTIRIAYLYYDLLNLNGENGNIKILKQQLEKQNITVQLDLLTTTDEINATKYDLFYLGGGTENHLRIALNHLRQYQKAIYQAIEDHKFFLVTGNALELFGKSGINFFQFEETEADGGFHEVTLETDFIGKEIVGLLNQKKDIVATKHPFFKNSQQGVHYINFFAPKTFGPIFAKNPLFLEYFIKQLILFKEPLFTFKPLEFEFEEMAYYNYQKLMRKNLIK